MEQNTHIVCLGGGIGTVNLVKGLRAYTDQITVVVSMADEGGSAGRLRRLYTIMPPGDVVSCMAALSTKENPLYSQFLTYRFPGDRYGADHDIAGHKMGNLMMVAARDLTGSFEGAIQLLKELFHVKGNIFPATNELVSISAKTIDRKEIHGEEAIDLGKYEGKRILDHVYLHPENPTVSEKVLQSLTDADVIIAGPGDLYTTILPVLITPAITKFLLETNKPKIFVVNVANKPFETKGYSTEDFINAITKHLGVFPFTTVITNNNFSYPIPKKYHYSYVKTGNLENSKRSYHIIEADLVNEAFPLYHDEKKLASVVYKTV